MYGFVQNLNFLPIWPQFGLCLVTFRAHAQKWQEFHFQSNFLPKILKPPWTVSYSTTNFGGTYPKIYACFEHKTAFVMQNFPNLGLVGVGQNPKRHILG